MTKQELLAALRQPKARVFARVRFGGTLFKNLEQTKKDMIAAIATMDEATEFGANISKSGHVYVYGVRRDEAAALGELEDGTAVAQ